MNLVRGKFRVKGDILEIHPAYEEFVVRIELLAMTSNELQRLIQSLENDWPNWKK